MQRIVIPSMLPPLLTNAIEYLREQLRDRLIAIYQFGSFGTSYQNAASDVDLAILCDKPLAPMTVFNLATELGLQLSRDVDLIDLLQASTVLAHQILQEGNLIYCANDIVCATFDTYVESDYIELNEKRQGLLQDIHRRGHISG